MTSNTNKKYPGKITTQTWGYEITNENNEQEKIDDAKVGEPIFSFLDRLTVDASWAPNIKEPVETTIGNLLFNYICILSSFGAKHAFLTGKVTVSKIEDNIAPLLKDTPATEDERSTEYYYVDEYIKFVDSLQFLSRLTQLATVAGTRRTITAPTGIAEFKKQLEGKYGSNITDPVELAAYEKELLDFDSKYLEGDKANNTFMVGKLKHTARKKMFLAIGAEKSFSDSQKVTAIGNSLEEGWPTDPVKFTAIMNGNRIGSFFRGAETVKGGVSAKYLLRAANNFKIVDTDCGSKLGLVRFYDKSKAATLVGKTVFTTNGQKLIENINEASNFLDKILVVRSPMYCKVKGDNLCKVCAGERLARSPTGLAISLTEISGIILNTSMKAMHVNNVTTAKLDINKAFT